MRWDVFHSDRLELAKGLSTEEVRAGLAAGSIRDDDLVRASGSSAPWARVAEFPELTAPPSLPTAPASDAYEVEHEPEPTSPPVADDDNDEGDVSFPVLAEDRLPSPAPIAWDWEAEDEEDDEFEELAEDESEEPSVASVAAVVADWGPGEDDLPTARSRDDGDSEDVDEEEGDGEVISLRRAGPAKVEEPDLAAMVDVAFQLVLFFLVTATTILYKTLEIPKPSGEAPPEAVAQGRNRTLDDLQEDYIVVEIDPEGRIQIDREPVAANLDELAKRLRSAREKTDRKTMLLSADFSTPHRSAVLAYDAANEIGMSIAVAKPAPPAGPPPALRPAAAAKKEGA